MTAYANFRAQARGIGLQAVQAYNILPDSKSPGTALTAQFGFQSYFDTAAFQLALRTQAANQPIIDNTQAPAQQANIPGYAIGLHPSSQTPVTVLPLLAGQSGSSQPVILTPGQIYRPHGRPDGKQGNFSGFQWGVPFGWLGGGISTLYVFCSPDADVAWPGRTEVIFHRVTLPIYTPSSAAAALTQNWPTRFPWPNANRAGPVVQGGAPVIAVEPTKTLMALSKTSLANPTTVRMYMSQNVAVAPAPTYAEDPLSNNGRLPFVEFTWGTYTAAAAALTANVPTAATQNLLVTAPTEVTQLAADYGGLLLWSDDPNNEFGAGSSIDFLRYGRL